MDQKRLSALAGDAKFGAEQFAKDLAAKQVNPEHMMEMYNGLILIIDHLIKDVDRLRATVTALEKANQSQQTPSPTTE